MLTAQLVATTVRSCHSAAVATIAGSLVLRSVVLADTQPAPVLSRGGSQGPLVGDGLLAHNAVQVTVEQALIANNARAGAFFSSTGLAQPLVNEAKMTATALTRSVFGVVVQGDAQLVLKGWLASGNSQQNFAGNLGLSVPEPPQPVAVDNAGSQRKPKF